MTGAIVFLGVAVILFILIRLSRRSEIRSDERRSRDLFIQATAQYRHLAPVEALEHVYDDTYRAMIRVRKEGGDYEDLFHDTILLWNLRNEYLRREVEEDSEFSLA